MRTDSHCFTGEVLIFPIFVFGGQISAQKLSLEEKINKADMIVVGRVRSVQSSWQKAESGKRIVTLVRLSVSAYAKGSAGKEIEIIVPGGSVDGLQQVNSGLPEFSEGEEVVLFLEGRPLQLMGSGEGKYSIKNGIVLGLEIPIEEFIGQVKKTALSDLTNKRNGSK